jgi:gliding motility-associated-like protein
MNPRSKKTKKQTVLLILTLLLGITNGNAQLVAQFSATVTSGCAPILVNFTDQSTGNPTEWRWDLGNGTISSVQHPSVTYFNAGTYHVRLIIKNATGQDSVVKTNYITVYALPLANFSASVTEGCNPVLTTFTHLVASANLVSHQWDFGDGEIDTAASPTHRYTQPGKFHVSLQVTSSQGCISFEQKQFYITSRKVKSGFSIQYPDRCNPQKVQFVNSASGDGTLAYQWFFGNGDTSTASTPLYHFANAGSYTVKLVTTSSFGCTDTLERTITIAPRVTASFSTSDTFSCKKPFPVQFTNTLLPGHSYLWNFGDSGIASTPNARYTYKDTGTFTVRLIATNNNTGCKDTVTKANYIKIDQLYIRAANLPDSACSPFSKKMHLVAVARDTALSFFWDMGNGQTSTQREPTGLYTNTGYYKIVLIGKTSTGCRDTITYNNAIKISQKPVANFTVSHTNTCASTEILFTNTSTGPNDNWIWEYGDYNISTQKNPQYIYSDTGYKTVTLISRNGGCADTIVKHNILNLKPAVAKLSIQMDCSNPFKRTFTNSSIGATSYLWKFGDGSTSTLANPQHVFPDTGFYEIELTAFNNITGCDYQIKRSLKVIDTKPNFYASDSVICHGRQVKFKAYGNEVDIARYFWDFGDGTQVNFRNGEATHTYTRPGTYSVRLITLNVQNCRDTLRRVAYVSVRGPKAKFSIGTGTCVGKPIQFTDSSVAHHTSPIKNWIWNYGNNKRDTLTTPGTQHIYTTPARYTVTLKIIDMAGCTDSIANSTVFRVTSPNANFVVNDTVACKGTTLRFSALHADASSIFLYEFGDGTTDSRPVLWKSYNIEGAYSVKAKITDINGCVDSVIKMNLVKVEDPTVDFTVSDSFKTCPPMIVDFTNQSTKAIESNWSFGNGTASNLTSPTHSYSYPGTYTATLSIKGRGGCTKTKTQVLKVKGPTGTFNYTPLKQCSPYLVSFKARTRDAISYVWDFNDGNTLINNDSMVRHTYRDSGNFIPSIMLIDNLGCRVPISGSDTIRNIYVKAGFTLPSTAICGNGTIQFTNTTLSNDTLLTYAWDFGDSQSSTQKNPLHTYTVRGSYLVKLKVTSSAGCSNTYQISQPLSFSENPVIAITHTPSGCTPLAASFTATLQTGDTSTIRWIWRLPNGDSSVLATPMPQTYTQPGFYKATLTGIYLNGCRTTITDSVEVFSLPQLSVSNTLNICKGQSGNISARGAASYNWMPAIGLACSNCGSTSAAPVSNTTYNVTGTNANGCVSSKTVQVNVAQPITVQGRGTGNLCKGSSKKIQAEGAITYQWSPAAGLSNTIGAEITVQPDSTTRYQVVGKDERGCFSDTSYVTITVYPIPTVNAGSDKSTTAGTPIDLDAVVSADVTQVQWYPTDALSRNANGITVKPTVNTEYTVEVTNAGGCAARDRVFVQVLCNNASVFLPNLFSPNGDGVNDVFYVRGSGSFKVVSLRIFNRWGQLVFSRNNFTANDPAQGWDGSYKGQKLGSDTFVYMADVVCENNGVTVLKGNISLVR